MIASVKMILYVIVCECENMIVCTEVCVDCVCMCEYKCVTVIVCVHTQRRAHSQELDLGD